MIEIAECAATLIGPDPAGTHDLAGAVRYVAGQLGAGATDDVRVGLCGQDRHERLDHTIVPRQPVGSRLQERWYGDLEGGCERRRVLPRDAIALGSQLHGFEERDRGLVGDVLLRRGAEAT